MSATAISDERVLVIERVFAAPRRQVFEAWTSARNIARWWGPKDFSVPFSEVDARPGGRFCACIRSPGGEVYWMQGEFIEVRAPERLVFTWAWEGDDGRPGHETLITITVDEKAGKSRMTFRQEVFESVESRDSHEGGWTECFVRLGEYLAGER